MNENTIVEVKNNIDEKCIREAEDFAMFRRKINRKRKWRIVIALVVLFLLFALPISGADSGSGINENDGVYAKVDCMHLSVNINEGLAAIIADMDVKINHATQTTSFDNNAIFRSFNDKTGIGYDHIISSVPSDYEISALYCVESRFLEGKEFTEYLPHDYAFVFDAEEDKEITVKICPFEEPVSDCIIICEDPVLSEIGTEEVLITYFSDTYYAEFEKDGIYYHIEAENASSDELNTVLINLISSGGMNG